MRRATRHFRPLLRNSAVATSLVALVACTSFDSARRAPPTATLGEELYGVLCDRLGATVLTEDLEGLSYHGVCHRSAEGAFSDAVDESRLPPTSGTAALTRELALAKLKALVRRRPDVIKALDATFTDEPVEVPGDPSKRTISGYAALAEFLKTLAPLHESNPAGGGEPLFPSVTRAAGRLFASIAGPGPSDPITAGADPERARQVRQVLATMAGRQNYRPVRSSLGALSPALGYSGLRGLVQTLAPKVAEGGSLHETFDLMLRSTQYELDTAELASAPFAPLVVDSARFQPSRPRTKVEVAASLLLTEDDAFERVTDEPRFLAVRDLRGIAIPRGNVPGRPGTVPEPFVDSDGDGLADVDGASRFLGSGGKLAAFGKPFAGPGDASGRDTDDFGRVLDTTGAPVFATIDTSRTLAASLIRDLAPLMAPKGDGDMGGTVTALLQGAYRLYGEPVARESPWDKGTTYWSFDTGSTEEPGAAPLLDFLHATGQLFAHPHSDDWLAMLDELATHHEQEFARFVGGALTLRKISNEHPEAKLDRKSVLWDELGEWLTRAAKDPAFFKDMFRAFADERTQKYLGNAFAEFNEKIDLMSYDPANLNGRPKNLTTPGAQEPVTPVDRSQPDVGSNRSLWQRFAQTIHDMNGVTACNRQGAQIKIKMKVGVTIPLTWPMFGGSYDECALFEFKDIGLIYLESLLDAVYKRNPPKGALVIKDDFLGGVAKFLGGAVSMAKIFEDSSGIQGFSDVPTNRAAVLSSPEAFHRLVFFGSSSSKFEGAFPGSKMPDLDPFAGGSMSQTNDFISSLLDPLSTAVCPTRRVAGLDLADCSPSVKWPNGLTAGQGGNPQNLLRLRDQGIIFNWEMFNFLQGLAPILKSFSDHGQGQLFVDLVEVFYRHWPTEAAREECNTNGTWRRGEPDYNPFYCDDSGVSRYEPILSQALRETDLLASVGQIVKTLDALRVTNPRTGETREGLDIAHELVLALFDRDAAASVNVRDRFGRTTTTYVDGSVPPAARAKGLQVTPFDLFAQSMVNIDEKLEGDTRLTGWRGARSNLVDVLLAVDGEGEAARFHNRAVPKALPVLLRALREQINANCPNRESGTPCMWGKSHLAENAADTIRGATFGTVIHLLDKAFSEPDSRLELEKLLHHLLVSADDADVRHATLTSLVDLLQLLGDDTKMPALYWTGAVGAEPGTSATPGLVDRLLELLRVTTAETSVNGVVQPNAFDRTRMLDRLLKNLVTPMDADVATSATPLEVLLDALAEVNRFDASADQDSPLTAEDYRLVFGTVRDFMTSETRGLEQFYKIIQERSH